MTKGQRLAEASKAFLGVRFVLHGRDPATGLDCVGLVVASLQAVGAKVNDPVGYGLRNTSISRWLKCAAGSGLTPATGPIGTGDIILCQSGPSQHHLMIALDHTRAIHAHAGLRRVVEQPFEEQESPVLTWRLSD